MVGGSSPCRVGSWRSATIAWRRRKKTAAKGSSCSSRRSRSETGRIPSPRSSADDVDRPWKNSSPDVGIRYRRSRVRPAAIPDGEAVDRAVGHRGLSADAATPVALEEDATADRISPQLSGAGRERVREVDLDRARFGPVSGPEPPAVPVEDQSERGNPVRRVGSSVRRRAPARSPGSDRPAA